MIALSTNAILQCYAGPTVSPGRPPSAQRESRAGTTLSRTSARSFQLTGAVPTSSRSEQQTSTATLGPPVIPRIAGTAGRRGWPDRADLGGPSPAAPTEGLECLLPGRRPSVALRRRVGGARRIGPHRRCRRRRNRPPCCSTRRTGSRWRSSARRTVHLPLALITHNAPARNGCGLIEGHQAPISRAVDWSRSEDRR
jgi:hypothetical protein